MINSHYEFIDYEILKRYSDKSLSLLKNHKKEAFQFILHNFYDCIYQYDPSFAIKLYNNMKEYQIKLLDDNNEEIFDLAIKKYNVLIDEYFQNVIVDINEHNGAN